jgi:hypothetical protein
MTIPIPPQPPDAVIPYLDHVAGAGTNAHAWQTCFEAGVSAGQGIGFVSGALLATMICLCVWLIVLTFTAALLWGSRR